MPSIPTSAARWPSRPSLGEVANAEERTRLRERLFREARSAGILSHPGIVTIYDVEQQGDLAYIAMEYVDGPTLDQIISGQPLPPERMFAFWAKPPWPSITPIRRASCIATSSRPTS
jgi:serine/threonine protein kinase